MSSFFHWNPDPEIISFAGLSIRWYGLLFVGSFLLGTSIVKRIFKAEGKPDIDLDNLMFYMLLAAIIGARLAHCLIYEPSYYLSHPMEILYVWKGGLASHGGIVGAILALWLFIKRQPEISLFWMFERLTIPAALVATAIRSANFINSEIVGNPTQVPWAVVFERLDSVPRHPAQLYEALAYFVTFVVLTLIYRSQNGNVKPGVLSGVMFLGIFIARFLVEFVKVPQAAYGDGLAISVGQWLSVPFILLGLVLLLCGGKFSRHAK